MIAALRKDFNKKFSREKYHAFLQDIQSVHGSIHFRIGETPVFVPRSFCRQMLDACEHIVDEILQPDFKQRTDAAIPQALQVPGENDFPHCIAFDFGVCKNDEGALQPQLIEMQGFPSLFAFQVLLEEKFLNHYDAPPHFKTFLGGHNRDSYLQSLRQLILNGHDSQHVVLLDIFPEKQKTAIDFFCTETYTGVKAVCVSQLIKKGRGLFYNYQGKEIKIERIYNRLIFDELQQQEPAVQEKARILFEPLDVEWAPHPHWFYRISKFTLPMLRHPNIPETQFLHRLTQMPQRLEDYVLKPLFSFAGQGVVIDVSENDIKNISDPQHWILQKKVHYAPVIETPEMPAKAEIRIFYFWEKGQPRPRATNSLVRLSKGKMIGVRHNNNLPWTGGSFAFFEQ